MSTNKSVVSNSTGNAVAITHKFENKTNSSVSVGSGVGIDFINKMKINDYINYCGKASVLLDPLYFGAGNSFHESMYYGTPTITMPTDNIKSRIVLGAYKQMEIKNSPIVKNIDDYVSSAIEIANLKKNTLLETKKYYRECADKKLFKNERFIAELENIFLTFPQCQFYF